jgi:membrane protein implicated in regulation of membrane protease activity
MSWITDAPVLAWLGLALLLAAIEMVTLSFVFLMLALAALAGAATAAVGLPFPAQVVFSVIAGLLLVGFLRPLLVRRRGGLQDAATLTGSAALVGRTAQVLQTVTADEGRIKLGGEVWSAHAAAGAASSHPLSPGLTVRVVAIEGATAIVAADAPGPEVPS